MRNARPTADETALQTSLLIGMVVLIFACWSGLPDVVIATGYGVTSLGVAHACVSWSRMVTAEKRPIYTFIGACHALALIAVVCYSIWTLTSSIVSTTLVSAAATVVYFFVYFTSYACLVNFQYDGGSHGANTTEPANAHERRSQI